MVKVIIKASLFTSGAFKTVHIVYEMGEDNFIFLKILHPFRFPFEGNETVIVNGRKGAHHFRNGKVALANEIISFFVIGIAKMNVLYVCAKVADGFVRRFPIGTVRVMHIPKCTEIIGSKLIHKGTKSCGVGINSAGLDKKNNAHFFSIGNKFRNGRFYGFFIVIERSSADVRNFKVMGGVNKLFYGIGISGNGNIDGRIKAGDFYSAFAKISCGCGGAVFMERILNDEGFYDRWMSLYQRVKTIGIKEVVEEAAYTWFNRLMAVKIMQENGWIDRVLDFESEGVRVPLLVANARRGVFPAMSVSREQGLRELLEYDTKTTEQFNINAAGIANQTKDSKFRAF